MTAGCGGMGGAQPLAGKLAGAVTLVIDVNRKALERRHDTGYLDTIVDDFETAERLCRAKLADGVGVSVGLCANAATVLPLMLERDIVPDVVTDQTEPDAYRAYVPEEITHAEWEDLHKSDPARVAKAAEASMLKHFRALLTFRDRGAVVFEYGNNFRSTVS